MKPTKIKLILPKHDGEPDYDLDNEEHSQIAIYFDTKIDCPECFSRMDEMLFAENVAPHELPKVEERAKWVYQTLLKDMDI